MKYFECYHNKYGDASQCPRVAHWRSKGAGNFTDGWTWCDEHVTAATDYREPIDYASTGEPK